MRKNDLIKLLQDLPGNPEIVLWNATVGDYQQIEKLAKFYVYKPSFNIQLLRYERSLRKGEPSLEPLAPEDEAHFRKTYNAISYQPNDFVNDKDVKDGHWKRKTLLAITAKSRGLTSQSRGGDVEY